MRVVKDLKDLLPSCIPSVLQIEEKQKEKTHVIAHI